MLTLSACSAETVSTLWSNSCTLDFLDAGHIVADYGITSSRGMPKFIGAGITDAWIPFAAVRRTCRGRFIRRQGMLLFDVIMAQGFEIEFVFYLSTKNTFCRTISSMDFASSDRQECCHFTCVMGHNSPGSCRTSI